MKEHLGEEREVRAVEEGLIFIRGRGRGEAAALGDARASAYRTLLELEFLLEFSLHCHIYTVTRYYNYSIISPLPGESKGVVLERLESMYCLEMIQSRKVCTQKEIFESIVMEVKGLLRCYHICWLPNEPPTLVHGVHRKTR